MASWSNSKGSSGVQYYDGQQEALGALFQPGGAFSRFMSGAPNAGFERAQANGLEQLKQRQAQSGTLNSPLGTRMQSDFLQKTTQAAGDDWMKTLFQWMQPAGQTSKSKGSGGGVL